MSKKLAIRGHSTRGKEVIKLLEMMGGSNIYQHDGEANAYSYYVSGNAILHDRLSIAEDDDFVIFTIEEFLEKYPFKIHDTVNIPEYESAVGICGMYWDGFDIQYVVYRNDEEECYTAEDLLKYNDNPNEPSEVTEEKDKDKAPNLKGEDYYGKRFGYKIPNGYEFDKVDNGKIILKPIKSKYPKTFKECRAILDYMVGSMSGYKSSLLASLQSLLVCRDAYWKIAGEEMGLGKPWTPDWNHINRRFYCIYNSKNSIVKNVIYSENKILTFPTEEMRDAFYENFKDLIE